MKPHKTLVALLLAAGMTVGALATAAANQPTLASIPYPLEAQVGQGSWSADKDALTLVASAGTDLFVSPDGREVADNTARVLFVPKGDFILSAKVSGAFKSKYDGGALIVYGDRTHWGKLLFEQGGNGEAGVWTTVAKDVGDDAYHGASKEDAVYLKIARQKDMVVFYRSADGKQWQMIRTFGMPSATPLRVGFSSQSPTGKQFSARFSEIKLRAATFKDYWQGE
ncbi:MAG: DUF1349 domain-containing protein [Gammaproteobacteria bacterium]